MATSLLESMHTAIFLAVFSVLEMPGVVAFDSTADAIDFLESSADLDELAPLGVVEWDHTQQRVKGVYWQYSSSISTGMIMAGALQGFTESQH